MTAPAFPVTAVTGASGQLGRLVIAALLERGVPAERLVAAVRSPGKAADLGVPVRRADYDDPATLAAAFEGVEQLLLISANVPGIRLPQHTAVVEAAVAAGVQRIVYTSALHAQHTKLKLAQEHEATEDLIAATGLPHAFLRNGWYTENYTGQLATQLQNRTLVGATAGAPVSLATRQDFAEAAAVVLTTEGTDGAHELAGEAVSLADYAAEVTAQTGTSVTYNDLSENDYAALLVGAGLPEELAAILADSDVAIARGDLSDESGTLARLIGHPTTPLSAAVATAVAALG